MKIQKKKTIHKQWVTGSAAKGEGDVQAGVLAGVSNR
jgi:hypothetical protein